MKFLPYEDVPLFIGVDSGSGSSSGPSGKTFELLVNGTTYEFSESGATHNDKPVYTDSGNNYYIAFYEQMYLAYTGGNYAGWYVYTNNDDFTSDSNVLSYDDSETSGYTLLASLHTISYDNYDGTPFDVDDTTHNGEDLSWDTESYSSFESFESDVLNWLEGVSGGSSGGGGQVQADSAFIFASNASLSVSQSTSPKRYVDDNKIRICQFGNGETSNYPFSSPTFGVGELVTACFGPENGPPKPLSTSIFKIPKDTKITFPGGKHLFFDHDVFPDGYDYLARLRSTSGTWELSEGEAQSGYFEPIYDYSSNGPAVGSLDVQFYPDTGNLKNFFNITGISNAAEFPPLGEDKLTGHLGDFKFSDAYLKSFKFSISPNSIVSASASFEIYGPLTKDTSLSANYYSTGLYQQKSIPHGETSQVIGATQLGMDHTVSFSYSIDVTRVPRITIGNSVPTRVSKKATSIDMSLAGNNLNPSLLTDGITGKRANLSVQLKDLGYQNFTGDNTHGLMNIFDCSGVIQSQSLSVGSNGYLNGNISVKQHLR